MFVPGFRALWASLNKGEGTLRELWLAEGKRSRRAKQLLALARERGVPVRFKKDSELSSLLPGVSHQGMVGITQSLPYVGLERVVEASLSHRGLGLLLALDHITDEGNLGSLIRTAGFFGAHGLIVPQRRSAGLSPRVVKRSSGGYLSIPVVRVVNMARTLDLLEDKGYWIIGASGEAAESVYDFDWVRDVVLVLGNEQRGLSDSARKKCSMEVSIPCTGEVDSLNVAVAGGVILSEIIRQRSKGSRGEHPPKPAP